MGNGEVFIPAQRRERIVQLLRQRSVLSVRELTEILGVSHMTVRRDIDKLTAEGRAVPVPGGVRVPGQLTQEPPFRDKSTLNITLKRAIAAEAARRVADDMTIYLDAGTTLGQIVPFLDERNGLTVVTNDFTTLAELNDRGHRLIHLGGLVDQSNRSSVGTLAAQMLTQINLDIAIISASCWDASKGTATPAIEKVEVKRAAMKAAGSRLLAVDSSKYGMTSAYRVAGLDEFDAVITDDGLPLDTGRQITRLGVELVLAPEPPAVGETSIA